MGGGNGQKAKMARERNLEKQKAAKGNTFLSLSLTPLSNLSLIGFRIDDLCRKPAGIKQESDEYPGIFPSHLLNSFSYERKNFTESQGRRDVFNYKKKSSFIITIVRFWCVFCFSLIAEILLWV